MIVTRVETRDFRNLREVALTPHPRFSVLCGDNAQGKTNLLEAVYLLAMRRSFRAGRTAEMICFGAERATVRGRANVGALVRDIEVQLRPDGRRVLVDGKGVRASSPKLEGLAAVLFTPDDLQVPRGAPSARRQLLDNAIATVWPGYQSLCRDYQKTLATRNRLLREPQSGAAELLDVYDAQLSQLGAKVIAARRRYLAQLLPRFEDAFGRIAHSGLRGTLRYRSDEALVDCGDVVAALKEALSAALTRARATDLARKASTVGPHTDDVAFLIDDKPARQYGSQGQVRSLVLAFRISQILDSYDKLQHYPVLLLDDVSSELDARRNAYLFDFLREITCQVLITTTRPELIAVGEDRKDFQVVKGVIGP